MQLVRSRLHTLEELVDVFDHGITSVQYAMLCWSLGQWPCNKTRGTDIRPRFYGQRPANGRRTIVDKAKVNTRGFGHWP